MGTGGADQASSLDMLILQCEIVKHFRSELWFPRLLDRDYYQAWLESGAASMKERCSQRRKQILDRYEPEPVAPQLEQALDELVEAARREFFNFLMRKEERYVRLDRKERTPWKGKPVECSRRKKQVEKMNLFC